MVEMYNVYLKIKIIILYIWMTHLVIHCKHHLVMGILAALDLVSVQFLSITFKEHCYGWVWFASGHRSWIIAPVRFIVHMFKRLSVFPEPLRHICLLVFLYNSAFIARCTFPLYFSNPAMSCLIWIDKNRTLCSKWNPTREMYYSHHYHCLRHRVSLLWMLF